MVTVLVGGDVTPLTFTTTFVPPAISELLKKRTSILLLTVSMLQLVADKNAELLREYEQVTVVTPLTIPLDWWLGQSEEYPTKK